MLELWEGAASDAELRFAGSSGGAASALALYGIERGGQHGVLHIDARDDVPWLNRTRLSRSRAELLAATGSRYAPASPCDGLSEVEAAPAPCVFIGKPCDVAATWKARRKRPALDEKLGIRSPSSAPERPRPARRSTSRAASVSPIRPRSARCATAGTGGPAAGASRAR